VTYPPPLISDEPDLGEDYLVRQYVKLRGNTPNVSGRASANENPFLAGSGRQEPPG